MIRGIAVPALLVVAFSLADPAIARAQDPFADPSRRERFMVDLALGYSFLAGEVGDSITGGPGIELSGLYQIRELPLRVGGGAGFAVLNFEGLDETRRKLNVFAGASWLLYSEESAMTPYIQGRFGWTHFNDDVGGVSSSRSGLEIGVSIGADIPVTERISVDVSGLFTWINTADAQADGIPIPDTSKTGSMFAIRAGAFLSTN